MTGETGGDVLLRLHQVAECLSLRGRPPYAHTVPGVARSTTVGLWRCRGATGEIVMMHIRDC